MQWRRSGSPRPASQKLHNKCKNPLEIFRLAQFFGVKNASSPLITFQKPNYQHGVLLISAGAIEGHLEGKTPRPREGHKWGLFLARQCSGSPATCNPEETGLPGLPLSWSSTLFSGSGPVGLPPVPWTEKQLKGRHFSSDAGVIAAAETWLDAQRSEFFCVACKS